MNKITRILFMGLGFGLVVSALSLVTSIPAPAAPPAPSIPVTVSNTPLAVQGSVNANVTNTVPVSGTVALSSLPAVSIGSTVTVPVTNTDNPALNPVAGGCVLINVSGGAAQNCTLTFFGPTGSFSSVPAGNRLVIDFVSGSLTVPSGTVPYGLSIRTSLGLAYTDISLDIRFVGTGVVPGPDLWIVSQQTRIYEDPGASVIMTELTTAPASSTLTAGVTVTGHLVPIS